MNHVAAWLWYYETSDEFDRQVCQDHRRPSPHIQVMVPPNIGHAFGRWRASERELVEINAQLRHRILPVEVTADREAKLEALDLHAGLQRLPDTERAEARRRLMPGYDSVAPELEEIIHPTEPLLQPHETTF